MVLPGANWSLGGADKEPLAENFRRTGANKESPRAIWSGRRANTNLLKALAPFFEAVWNFAGANKKSPRALSLSPKANRKGACSLSTARFSTSLGGEQTGNLSAGRRFPSSADALSISDLSEAKIDENFPNPKISGHGEGGIGLFVELHVEVDPSATIREGHRIGHEVKAALISSNSRIQDVIVHLEPAEEGEGHSDTIIPKNRDA